MHQKHGGPGRRRGGRRPHNIHGLPPADSRVCHVVVDGLSRQPCCDENEKNGTHFLRLYRM